MLIFSCGKRHWVCIKAGFKKKASLINVHSFIAEVKLRGGGGPEGEVVPDPPPQEAT